ncbi:GSCOCG00003339001-RA-CDS [Cotesia congregata]|nr:GSCOCG00003339001-RA-CDS [Cotesia congregata]
MSIETVIRSVENLPKSIDNIQKNGIVSENSDWTNMIFEKILLNGLRDYTIQDVAIINKRLACTKGQNFLSQVWRLSLRYTCVPKNNSFKRIKKIVHLIMKEEPLPGFSLDFIRENGIFNVELMVFTNILPSLERLTGRQFAPRFFSGSTQPPTIILEDLKPLGFKNKCRQSGLSQAHMLKVIEAIAQFHAGSAALNEQQPGRFLRFTSRSSSEETHASMYDWLDFIIDQIADKIRKWSEPWAIRASDKLKKLRRVTQHQKLLKVSEYDNDEFCVLNHGDCWIGNFMFRENENGVPLEVRMLDFQMSVWTSPAVDLHYFINTCPEVSLKVDYDDYFIKKYVEILSKSMKRYGCSTPPPTLQDITRAMHKRRIYGLMSGLIFYPRMIADVSDIEAIDDCFKSGTTKMNIFKNPRAVKALKKMIPAMLEKGYLD